MSEQLKTYGDLKKLIKYVKLKQKGGKILAKGKEVAIDQILGLLPGASNIKTSLDFFKAAFSKPDTVKTNTWLDKLDIDDEISKIVDDTVENSFLEYLTKSLDSISDDKPLDDDFNINNNLQNYIKQNFKNRSVIVPESYIYNKNKDMSKISKLIKEGIMNLLETKGFEDMEVAFGVKHKSDNLSDDEKKQFGPMGQLKTTEGGSFATPDTNGTREVKKSNNFNNKESESYYKEVVKKIKDFQTPGSNEKIEGPRVPTNTNNEDERIEDTGYDVGISGLEVTADLASKKGGSESTKKIYKDRVKKIQGDDKTYDKLISNASKTNDLKYKKDAVNTRPVKSQTSKQSEMKNEGRMVEADFKMSNDPQKLMTAFKKFVQDKYPQLVSKIDQPLEKAQVIAAFANTFGIDPGQLSKVKSILDKAPEESEEVTSESYINTVKKENIFKVKGVIKSEKQIQPLFESLPNRVKVDETIFEITDGKNTYRYIWEGDTNTGEPVLTNQKNSDLVKEDIEKMKHLWGFKSDVKVKLNENPEDTFKKMYRKIK
jgi:hypothetical protein